MHIDTCTLGLLAVFRVLSMGQDHTPCGADRNEGKLTGRGVINYLQSSDISTPHILDQVDGSLANISLRGPHAVYVLHDYWVSGWGHLSDCVTWELSGSRKGPLKTSSLYLPLLWGSLRSAGPAHCSATTTKGKMSPRLI